MSGTTQPLPSRLALFADRRFLLLWAAMLVSATGTFMLLLAVSAELLKRHGSGLGAASVFAFQWILPVVAVSLVRRLAESRRLRRTVILAEIAGAVISLAIGLLLTADLTVAVLACFLIRGLAEAVTKTSRVVLVKLMFQGPALTLASSTFNLSFYVGGALGGLAGAVAVEHLPLIGVCAVDAMTFLISAACYRALPDLRPSGEAPRAPGRRRGAIAEALSLMRADRRLWLAAGYVVAATGVLQGFHNTARVVLPMRHLGLGESAVMHLQITSGLAIILGALAIPVLGALARHRGFAPLTHLGACVMLWAVTLVAGETGLHLGYFAYIFLFEAAFTAAQAQLIQATPSRDMATMQAAVGALGTSLLIGCTLLSGALADLMPLPLVAAITAGIGVVILLAIEAGSRHGIRKAAGI
ncbi:MFS transporter [Tistrella mobilis]|uniref:MFS transporter n=1 Tax=Tistrella mobilis TaxID=171437 RepID=UPI00355840EB